MWCRTVPHGKTTICLRKSTMRTSGDFSGKTVLFAVRRRVHPRGPDRVRPPLLGRPALFGPPPRGPKPSTTDLPPASPPSRRRRRGYYSDSNPEARKAFEAAQQQKEQEAREGVKPGDETSDGERRTLPQAEGAPRRERGPVRRPRYDCGSPLRIPPFGSASGRGEETARPLRSRTCSPPGRRRRGSPKTSRRSRLRHRSSDEVVVRMWGRMEGTQRLTVDRDGKIFFPKLGSFHVAGKTFES